ncbi:MAG: glycoside hydrolase family 15 protein, partial [Thermoplasmata archaeon]|nr:glycoside hydrolase family 15 protein [Thermoplasmata archaeon]
LLLWIVGRRGEKEGGRLNVLYLAHDGDEVQEREIPGLSGFLGSRPVRVGNAAVEQFQLDIYGEVMDAAALLVDRQEDAVRPVWPRLAELAGEVERTWEVPDHGIWEVRTPPLHYVH